MKADPSPGQRQFTRLLVIGYLAAAWGGLVWLYAYAPHLAWVMGAETAIGDDTRNAILASTVVGCLAWTLICVQLGLTQGRRVLWLLPGLPLAWGGPILFATLALNCALRGACP